ncbi:B3 domain-containing protein Os01g0234100-like [Chenopodium quinoa]|uniref:B3 domain-containing protein Os01g0234100-like n=1 Tax=Chenopodium quinoa TaxID=63459 RepID=UPI000B78644A|nr:B3 domain-containing protein Os01g0234100-like [Chenopodium quinoa]
MEIKTPVKEAENRKKSVDLKKEKSVIAKKDLKLALVAKRLSMLQDGHQTEIQPILPLQNQEQSESTKPSKDMDTSDHTLFEDNVNVMSKSSKIRTKIESHKRARDISDDDESSKNRELVVWVPQQKKERAKKKRVKTNDLSHDKNAKASEISITQKFRRSDLSDPLPSGDKSSSLKRAEEIQANLPDEYPSFVKLMLKSHVSGGFWLGLPKKFCDKHLPVCDSNVVLVDEAGKKSSTKYLAAKVGLSGGWRGFSIDHGLLEGDVLVFQLIAPTKFQIYVVRGQTFGEVDGSIGLLTLDPGVGQQISEGNSQKVLQTEEDNNTSSGYLSQSNSDIESGPEVLEGIQFSDSDIKFEGVEAFEDFHIVIDDLIMDSKFSTNTLKKYYELCHSQSSFLHENFLKGLNCNLVVGIIAETINIADAIKSCKKASTSHEDLRVWEKTLKGFEMLGMKVDFLVTHINQLLGIAVESDTADESNKLKESIIKRALAEERMKLLENKLTQLKDSMQKINFEMDAEIKMSSALKQEARIKEIIAI